MAPTNFVAPDEEPDFYAPEAGDAELALRLSRLEPQPINCELLARLINEAIGSDSMFRLVGADPLVASVRSKVTSQLKRIQKQAADLMAIEAEDAVKSCAVPDVDLWRLALDDSVAWKRDGSLDNDTAAQVAKAIQLLADVEISSSPGRPPADRRATAVVLAVATYCDEAESFSFEGEPRYGRQHEESPKIPVCNQAVTLTYNVLRAVGFNASMKQVRTFMRNVRQTRVARKPSQI